MKYAVVERERRWLLEGVPPALEGEVIEIVDRYVTGTRLRLRETRTDVGGIVQKLGHKVRLTEGPEEVACTSLYLDESEWQLLQRLPAAVLSKTRTLTSYDGATV